MIDVDSFILRNIVHFNEAKVPVRKNNGLVIISGLNKDSRIADDQNNGAGKSLLWSAIPNLRYAAAPSSTLKNTKKDMLDSTKSEIELRFTNNLGQKIKVIQKPTKWIIYEPDEKTGKLVDIQARTTTIQQEKIAEHFPITQDEFYAYTFLSSIQGQRLHFQVDKPAERLKFITSIFQLDSYDRLKKFFTGMLSRIKDEQTKFDVLESKLLNVNSQLVRVNWSTGEAEASKNSKKEFKQLKGTRDKLARTVSGLEQILGTLKSLNRLIEKRNELLQDFPEHKTVDEVVARLRKRKAVIRAYEGYQKQKASYDRSTKRICDALEELDIEGLPGQKKLIKKWESLEASRVSLHEKLSDTRNQAERRDRYLSASKLLEKKIVILGFVSSDDVDMEADIDDDISICRTTLKLKQLLHSSDDSVCPTCMQTVDLASVTKSVKKAGKRLQQLEALAEARAHKLRRIEISKDITDIGYVSEPAVLEARYDKLKTELQTIKKQIKVYQRRTELKDNLNNIESPEAPDKIPPKGADIDQIEEALTVCRELGLINHSIENLLNDNPALVAAEDDTASHVQDAESKLGQVNDKLIEVDKQYQKLTRSNSEYDLRLGEYRILAKQKLEFEHDIAGIKPLLEKRDLYKALEKAYSAKGLKVAKANEIARMLEANINRYSNLIFAEPFTFNVYATEKGVFCDVDRGNGKVTDVRLLSGSESDSFRLLFLLSLLLMVPSERRTNFVVLDEPDSHMDERTRSLFAERFIPFLREAVPHVFLITPLDHHIYRECERWVVIKDNGISRLVRNEVTTGE